MSGKSPERPKGTKTLRSNGTSNFAPTTILISIDGFRADYKDRGLTPALNSFIAKGVAPKYMLPSFRKSQSVSRFQSFSQGHTCTCSSPKIANIFQHL